MSTGIYPEHFRLSWDKHPTQYTIPRRGYHFVAPHLTAGVHRRSYPINSDFSTSSGILSRTLSAGPGVNLRANKSNTYCMTFPAFNGYKFAIKQPADSRAIDLARRFRERAGVRVESTAHSCLAYKIVQTPLTTHL